MASEDSIFSKISSIFGSKPEPTQQPLQPARVPGAYLFGNVGTGKTMLMDLFYSTTPVFKKRRTHFHKFMLGIHAKIHDLRMERNMDHAQVWAKIADDIVRHGLCIKNSLTTFFF